MTAGLPRVPGLRCLHVLARGGYATVYRAVQESVDRPVAVKVENVTLDTDVDRLRFLREARAAGRMSSHAHVVDLFDAGTTDDRHPYLIMELCQGSYADRLREVPMSPPEVCDTGMKIADALADAHRVGVLHRDVKPENILVSEFGEPALADFGLAVLVASRDTIVDAEVCSPAYTPREAFRPGYRPSAAGDVYALAATLYAMLAGRPPRWPEHGSPTRLEILDLFEQPVPDLPGVPGDLLEVIRAGMANDPRARPSAGATRDALAALAPRLRPPVPRPATPIDHPTAPPAGNPPRRSPVD